MAQRQKKPNPGCVLARTAPERSLHNSLSPECSPSRRVSSRSAAKDLLFTRQVQTRSRRPTRFCSRS